MLADLVIPAPAPVTLPVRDSTKRFPVRRIWCIGRNYADHALEMGFDPETEPPFFFSKPAEAIVQDGAALQFPVATADLHHEVELVVALASGGRNLNPETALEHVFGYAVGLDLTRRDLQAEAKAKGRPWDLAKGFDESAPVGEINPVSHGGHPVEGAVTLDVNGERRQEGNLNQQIWPVNQALAYLSTFVELKAGDLLMTGTPAGVGAVTRGDSISCLIEGVGSLGISYVH